MARWVKVNCIFCGKERTVDSSVSKNQDSTIHASWCPEHTNYEEREVIRTNRSGSSERVPTWVMSPGSIFNGTDYSGEKAGEVVRQFFNRRSDTSKCELPGAKIFHLLPNDGCQCDLPEVPAPTFQSVDEPAPVVETESLPVSMIAKALQGQSHYVLSRCVLCEGIYPTPRRSDLGGTVYCPEHHRLATEMEHLSSETVRTCPNAVSGKRHFFPDGSCLCVLPDWEPKRRNGWMEAITGTKIKNALVLHRYNVRFHHQHPALVAIEIPDHGWNLLHMATTSDSSALLWGNMLYSTPEKALNLIGLLYQEFPPTSEDGTSVWEGAMTNTVTNKEILNTINSLWLPANGMSDFQPPFVMVTERLGSARKFHIHNTETNTRIESVDHRGTAMRRVSELNAELTNAKS